MERNDFGGAVFLALLWCWLSPVAYAETAEASAHVVRRVVPKYPEDQKWRALPPLPCDVQLTTDGLGVPTTVTIIDCSQAFYGEADRAARKWRFDGLGTWNVQLIFRLKGDTRPNPQRYNPETDTNYEVPEVTADIADFDRAPAVRRRVPPVNPTGLTETSVCRAKVTVASTGKASAVDVSGCAEVLKAPTQAALSRWKWERSHRENHTDVEIRYTVQ